MMHYQRLRFGVWEYNQRKGRNGASWEDRYHATGMEADEHLHRCLVYIDLNMVRAGVVNHPGEWAHGNYREIQEPPKRYALIDLRELSDLRSFAEVADFQRAHREWVRDALKNGRMPRDDRWSEVIAFVSSDFVAKDQKQAGDQSLASRIRNLGRSVCAARIGRSLRAWINRAK